MGFQVWHLNFPHQLKFKSNSFDNIVKKGGISSPQPLCFRKQNLAI